MNNTRFSDITIDMDELLQTELITEYIVNHFSPASQSVYAEYDNSKDGLYFATLNEESLLVLKAGLLTKPFMSQPEIDRQLLLMDNVPQL